ncbi:MAG: hypothetical protein ACLGI8_06565 [Acidimicrobiia bacterium]|jgi:hypothetical protein
MSSPWRRVLLLGAVLLVGAACGNDEVSTGATTSTPSSVVTTGTIPARTPDVTGTVQLSGSDPVLVGASDPYFEGMALLRGEPTIIDATTGEVLTLEDGDEVAVWTEGVCAESYPVQCGILAIQVRR